MCIAYCCSWFLVHVSCELHNWPHVFCFFDWRGFPRTSGVTQVDRTSTLLGTNISPTFPFPRVGYVIVPWSVVSRHNAKNSNPSNASPSFLAAALGFFSVEGRPRNLPAYDWWKCSHLQEHILFWISPPSQDASGKWRFKLGSPTQHTKVLTGILGGGGRSNTIPKCIQNASQRIKRRKILSIHQSRLPQFPQTWHVPDAPWIGYLPTCIYHKNQPNVGRYATHGFYGYV